MRVVTTFDDDHGDAIIVVVTVILHAGQGSHKHPAGRWAATLRCQPTRRGAGEPLVVVIRRHQVNVFDGGNEISSRRHWAARYRGSAPVYGNSAASIKARSSGPSSSSESSGISWCKSVASDNGFRPRPGRNRPKF
jgi:hypothetical protein